VHHLGWRSGPNATQAFGQSLHKTLAAYLSAQNSEQTIERLFSYYDELWVNEGFSNAEETYRFYEQGREILELFFENLAQSYEAREKKDLETLNSCYKKLTLKEVKKI